MIEGAEQSAALEAEQAAERRSIGRYLAAQRKLRGISLDELAERTRIPRRNLERLESGVFDKQPDGFVRGFVRTVAEALGLDPREAVLRLVGEPAVADEDWLRRRRLRVALLAAAVGGCALLGLSWGLRETVRWISRPASDAAGEQVYRRDAVRELAADQPSAPAPADAAPPAAEPDAQAPPAEPPGTSPPAEP